MSDGPMSEHELLPWHVNGTLSPEEQERFREHLLRCAGCASEVEMLTSLKEQVERHGESFFQPHPDPETIVTDVLEGLPEPQASEMRRHLTFCPTCAAEVRILREGQKPAVRPGDRVVLRAGTWWKALPWVTAAAVILAVVLPLWLYLRPEPSRSDLVSTIYLEPPQRAGGTTRVLVAPGVTLFQVVVPVEPPEGGGSLSLEIRDSGGQVLLSRDGIRDLYRDRFLLILCDRKDFPDGDYRVLIRPSPGPGAMPAAPIELSFQVASR